MEFDLLAVGGLLDLLHDGLDLSVAPGVDGFALLLAGHATNMSSNVVENGRQSDINNIGLAEGCSDGKLVFLWGRLKLKIYLSQGVPP